MAYNVGTTVMLKFTFTDCNDALKDPVSISIGVYTTGKRLISTIPVVLGSCKAGTGIYELPFVIPEVKGNISLKITAMLDNYKTVTEQYIEVID